MAELSDSAILRRYGALFAEFDQAIRSDPWLLVDIVERWRAWEQTRELRGARSRREPRVEPKPLSVDAQIVKRRRQGATLDRIAAEFDYSVSTVKRICNQAGVTRRRPNPDLTDEERRIRNSAIRERVAEGLTYTQVAREFGLSRRAVGNIAHADTEP